MTLVETLTQRVPIWERMGHGDPILPKSLPSPFFDIVRNCLRRDPQRRCTIADISARLRPTSSVPLSPVSPAPAPQKLPAPPRPVIKAPKKAAAQRPIAIPRFALPLFVAVLAVAAIITVPKLLSRRPEPRKTPSVASENSTPQPRVQPKPEKAPASAQSTPSTPSSAKQFVQKSLKTASDKQLIKKEEASPIPEPSPAIAPSKEQPKASAAPVVPGEVLNQILPDVSQKARDTIRGRVRVSVKVHVDPSGDLAGAELDSRGPSKYFADLALQAARRWEFAPAKVDGSSVSTDWIVRFEFSQLDTKVFPVQTSPR
jgi:protein TonB